MSGTDLMDVFAYEAARVFRDRLVGSDAHARFDGVVSACLRSQWRAQLNGPSLFSSWAPGMDEDAKPGQASSLGAVSAEDFKAIVAQKLVAFEREVKDLNILLFPEVLLRMARLDRVLSKPAGSLLLVGR
jgi:dynein heavy chain 2